MEAAALEAAVVERVADDGVGAIDVESAGVVCASVACGVAKSRTESASAAVWAYDETGQAANEAMSAMAASTDFAITTGPME